MNIIVDTNIVFSAILSSRGKMGELLLNKPLEVQFYSPSFLLEELNLHTLKIINLTGLSETEYQQVKAFVIQYIEFVDLDNIAIANWIRAAEMIGELDEKDIPFLALALELNASLWTGDKKLLSALQHKKFNDVFTTENLYTKYFGPQ